MSQYCIIIANEEKSIAIEAWLARHEAGDDVIRFSRPYCTIYYLANEALGDVLANDGLFKGYAIEHDRRRIVYSGSGIAPEVAWPVEGCYLRATLGQDDVAIGNDLFGQLPMLYFASDGIVAVSDSALVLFSLRKLFLLSNRVHRDAALSRVWLHGMASQLLGRHTLVEGIFYCIPGTCLRVHLGERIRCLEEHALLPELFHEDITDYRDAIHDAAERTISLLSTFATIPGVDTALSLSGGHDSRTCLAAAMQCQNARFYFSTNINAKEDFAPVQKLAEKYNLTFGSPFNGERDGGNPLTGWYVSSALLSDRLVCGRRYGKRIVIGITGHGGEVAKGYFGWRALPAMSAAKVGDVSSMRPLIDQFYKKHGELCTKKFFHFLHRKPKVALEVSDAALRQASQGILAGGIAAENLRASEWHYICFRNAIFSGRYSASTMLDVPLLMQKSLVALSLASCNEYKKPTNGSPSIITDLLITLNSELAALPFDSANKNLGQQYIVERAAHFRTITNAHAYTVHGSPYAVHSGTPLLFVTIAQKAGFCGNFTDGNIKQHVAEAFEFIPDDIKPFYGVHKWIVENHFPERISASSWQAQAAGKIMAFRLTDGI